MEKVYNMSNTTEPVLLSERKDGVVYLTLNRPAVLNAMNKPLLTALQQDLLKIQQDRAIQAVVLTGRGPKAFSAGADIEYLSKASPLEVRNLANLAVSVTHLIENLGKVSIALINGFALGGGLEIAESCMLRVAVQDAKMGHPEVRIGAVAGWGGTTRLPRLIGKGRAAELLLTGKMIDAEAAYNFGLVNAVVPAEELHEKGNELLQEILANGPIAVNMSWDAIHRGLDMTIDGSAKLGADYFGLAASTSDFRAGTRAFIEKQEVKYTGT